MSDPLLASLRAAVAATPDDLPLRLHLAELLVERGERDEAVSHIATALAKDPANETAAGLMARALVREASPAPQPLPVATRPEQAVQAEEAEETEEPPPDNVVPLRFVENDAEPEAVPQNGERGELSLEVEASNVSLDDVGGMADVKKRLNAAFLAPLRNPKLRELYGKSLRGGLLLYGPPGCGKTFLAKAVAGELGAKFLSVGLSDVLDMWLGNSERNMHDVFVKARQNAPCVLFFDELDGIGQKRSRVTSGGVRNVVNQLLTELDGVGSANEGVFVLAATNTPWDVDVALRRPGRFDRTVLVLPPDDAARRSIIEYHLRDRPVAGVNLKALAKQTEGFSGADLAHLCDSAAERALLDSVESGEPRSIGMDDLTEAARQLRPSTAGWFATARNVVMYGNTDGTYDDLLTYMKKQKLL